MVKIKLIIFLLTLIVFSALNTKAQACGQSFAGFRVKDSANKSVSNVTVELAVALSAEQHKELWEKYAYKGEGFQPGVPFKIPVSVADDLIKQNLPLSRTQDFCGNPLKQLSNQTKVKTREDQEASGKNFGFCTIENSSGQYMLKISAPNYVTDYYIGSYLGGCSKGWYFVLMEQYLKKKFQSRAMPNKSMNVRARTTLSPRFQNRLFSGRTK